MPTQPHHILHLLAAGTPVEATLLTGCMAATLALLLDIGVLAELVSIGGV